MAKKYYLITATPKKTKTATARYGHRVFRAGKSVTVLRKLEEMGTKTLVAKLRSQGYTGVKIRKAKRKRR
jgi:hypothetical protein